MCCTIPLYTYECQDLRPMEMEMENTRTVEHPVSTKPSWLHVQLKAQLLLCLWIGRGQWKWRMEKMFVDRCPGSRSCGELYSILGASFWGNGQCRMENGTRKYIQCSFFEVLKHNKRFSTMQSMLNIPHFLKRAYIYLITRCYF